MSEDNASQTMLSLSSHSSQDKPTADEVELFTGTDIVIIRAVKHNPPDKPRKSTDYIRWRDIWDDKFFFRRKGSNNKLVWRAIALSVPAYHAHSMGIEDFQNVGFVVGVDMRVGYSPYQQIFEMHEIQWEQEPVVMQTQTNADS